MSIVQDLEKEMLERIKKFTVEQALYFSWLCAMRALPFLSVGRQRFSYWKRYNKQSYLGAIFNALDVGAYCLHSKTAKADDAAYAANAAANAAAYCTANVHAAKAAKAAYYTAKAANAAANAAYTTKAVAYTAVNAAMNVTYAANNTANSTNLKKFVELVLKDIKAIKRDGISKRDGNIRIYGDVWDNFQNDLNETGCSYWARLYANMFEKGFFFDEDDVKELERRLNVPDEIKMQGAAAVGQYLERLGKDIETLNEARIIILGEKGAGKTSIARRLLDINAPMPKEEESTEGVETSIWCFPDKDGVKNVNAHIWDFAGHSITHSAHRCFMSSRCLYIYVYNGRIERDNDPAYWLEQIRIHGGNSPVLFLINEKDGHKAKIPKKTLKNKYPAIVGYYCVDIDGEDKTELERFRQIVMDKVRDNPAWNSQIISAEAYKIKNELRELFDKSKSPHIGRKDFDAIAKKNGAFGKRIEEILADLHTLGICLWYNKTEMAVYCPPLTVIAS